MRLRNRMTHEVLMPGRAPLAVRDKETAETIARKLSKLHDVECEVRPTPPRRPVAKRIQPAALRLVGN